MKSKKANQNNNMKLFKLRGMATDKIRGTMGFFGTIYMNDAANETAVKKAFSARLRSDSDIDIEKIEYYGVEEVKNGFVFATHLKVVAD